MRIHRAMVVAALAVLVAPSASAQTIRGVVSEQGTYAPVGLGNVVLTTLELDTLARAVTDDGGYFAIQAPGSGSYYLIVSAFGFRPVRSEAIEVGDDEVRVVELTLAPSPLPISGLTVEAAGGEPEIATLAATGFYDRVADGRGEFILPGEIATSAAEYPQQLFWGRRLVRVHQLDHERPGPWNDVVRIPNRAGPGYCDPEIFIDGVRLPELDPGESLADVAPMDELEAVEIYDGLIHVPARYANFQDCGVILFWTDGR